MEKDRHTVVFYTTAVCNLRCKYCVIDKNPALKKIDDMLDESFKGDYYFNFVKKVCPDKNQLTNVEIWGGEPYLGMHRVYYTLEKLLNYYPNLNDIFGSSNLVSEKFTPEFLGLLEVLGKFNKPIKMRLQISLDGTQEITDLNRGVGVTEKLSKRMIELSQILPKKIPQNVTVEMFFKPTLDNNSLHLLNTKEKIINYYNFFEQFYRLFDKVKCDNLHLYPSKPNFAMPSDFTQEDGFFFRDFCKMTREIEREGHFKFLTDITLFSNNVKTTNDSLTASVGLCGTGKYIIGLLPNDMVSMCHMAFVDSIGDYKKEMESNKNRQTTVDENMFSNYYANNFCFPFSELSKYENNMKDFYEKGNKAKVATLANQIMLLAFSGQVNPKYKDNKLAIKASNFIFSRCSFCVKDNIGVTGSFYSGNLGLAKIFLNGAEDYILESEIK